MKEDLTLAKELLKAINENNVPWRKTWKSDEWSRPFNPITKTIYKGLNALRLLFHVYSHETMEFRYSTFNQIKKEGLSLRKGCHGKTIWFYGTYVVKKDKTAKDETEEEEKVKKCLKSYTVFNYDDVIIPEGHTIKPLDTSEFKCDKNDIMKIIKKLNIKIVEGNTLKPCYNNLTNVINMPKDFESDVSKYTTLMHEITHWTKNNIEKCKRSLAREQEELVAELGSFMLCKDLGIEYTPEETANYYDYLKGWLSSYDEDSKVSILNESLIYAGKANKEVLKALE